MIFQEGKDLNLVIISDVLYYTKIFYEIKTIFLDPAMFIKA